MLSISQTSVEVSWSEVIKYKKSLTIGTGLMMMQSLTGINIITYYSTTIFGYAGFDQQILATVATFGVDVFATVLSTYLVDTMGRRTLLLTGMYNISYLKHVNNIV